MRRNAKRDIKFHIDRFKNNVHGCVSEMRNVISRDRSFYKKHEDRMKIDRLYFEVSNICNAKCSFCAYRLTANKKRRGVMQFEIFKKAIDDYIKMGGDKISFTPTVGDALMDPGFIKKIRYAVHTSRLNYIYFYTNGIALAKNELYKEIVNSGINALEISTAGFNKKQYEKVFGVNKYDSFLEGVHKLVKYNSENENKINIRFNFRSPDLPSNVLNTRDYIKYIKPYEKYLAFDFISNYDNWGGMIGKDDMYGVMKLRRIPKHNRLPCIRTFDAAILFDGSVRLCACRLKETEFDDLVIGNVNNNSLEKIYYSSNAFKVREKFTVNNHAEVCKGCSFYTAISKRFIKNRLSSAVIDR